MSGPDAMHNEMPGFPPGRPGGERDEPLLDMIFDRHPIPPGAPPKMHDLASMLAVAAGPAESGDLAGEAAALAAFARLVSPASVSPAVSRPARRWLSRRPARTRLPLAAALVTAAAGLGSITAAYAGVLPSPIQQMAHVTVGAPAPPRDHSHRPPAVTRSQPGGTHDRSTSALPPSHSNIPSPTPDGSSVRPPHPGRSGRSPGPVSATCTPRPVPTHTLGTPGPTLSPPKPGAPGWTPRSPGAASCPAVVTQHAVPHPSR